VIIGTDRVTWAGDILADSSSLPTHTEPATNSSVGSVPQTIEVGSKIWIMGMALCKRSLRYHPGFELVL
jgi:hypothetical protein